MLATPALGQTIAITGGTVAIGDGSQPIEGGTVVIANGRIVAAGRGVAVPAGAQVVDATGKWIAAGMVSAPTDLSLVDSEGVRESSDVRARETPFNAAIDVSVAVNPNSIKIANERVLGVTRAISDALGIPVIASGGVGNLQHLADGVLEGHASAVLAASIFHFGEYTVPEAKAYMAARGIVVR